MRAARIEDIYVTGTDTGIGKTLASTVLLHALRARGLRATGMKPVASGCTLTADGWRSEDALALEQASDPRGGYDDVNPYALPQPVAPELAARDAGVEIAIERIAAAHARLASAADVVVVEGVGGWAAPLAATLDQVDVVRALRLSVVLVIGLRLGCLSHALLTARAIAADGVPFAGWIASEIDPGMARRDDNVAMLEHRLGAPCLGRLPHVPFADPAALVGCLRIDGRRARD